MAPEIKKHVFRYAQFSAAGAVLVGIAGVVAWFAHWGWFVRPGSDDATFTLTVSLSVLFTGGAAVGVLYRRRGVVAISAIALLILSGLTFYTEFTGRYAFLNQLGPSDYFADGVRAPGQMSVLSALCGVIIAVAALTQGFLRRESDMIVIPAVGYSAVTAINVVVLLGYASSLGSGISWSHLSGMSLPTALGMFLGATSLGVLGWRVAPRREGNFPRWSWLPLVVGVLAGTVVSVLVVSRHERSQTRDIVANESEQVAAVVDARARAANDSVRRVLEMLSHQQEITHDEWDRAAFDFADDVPGLLAMELETPKGTLRGWTDGKVAELTAPAWRRLQVEGFESHRFGVLRVDAGVHFYTGDEVSTGGSRLRILAVIDAEAFLDATIPQESARRHDLRVLWGDEEVRESRGDMTAVAAIDSLPGVRLEFTPTVAFLDAHDTPLAEGTAMAGVVVAALMGLVMHLAFISSARSHRMELLNRQVDASRQRLARLVEALPDAVITTDAAGRIEDVNDAGRRVFGLKGREGEGLGIQELFEQDPAAQAVSGGLDTSSLNSVMETRGNRVMKRRDGTTFPATVAAASFQTDRGRKFAWIFSDMTSQVEAEDLAKRKSSEVYDLAQRYANLKNCGAIAMAHTDLDGRIVDFNKTFCDLVGYEPDEFRGMLVSQLNHPDDAERGNRLLEELTRGERDYYRINKRYLRKDGKTVWVDVAATLVRDESGSPRYVVGLAMDVTQRIEARIALEESEARLRNANQELESIVYVASHDLRSPLVNLQGFSRQLAKSVEHLKAELAEIDLPLGKLAVLEDDMAERIPEALHFINASTMKMDRLIKGLLRLSRLGRVVLHPREVDMNRLVKDVLNSMRFMVTQHHIDVEVGELPPCWGDVDQLNQVFSNLLDNAIKYRSPDRESKIRITGRQERDECVYTVADNGIGIAPAHRKIIFEVFHRLSPRGSVEGEGLGLSVVRRILDRSRGSIELESEEGEGSRFIVTLPAGEPRIKPITEAKEADDG